ncbi:MAG: hypothetical protein IIA87_05975 [Nanoarchaeota archaeon]|nr:hypothetical protein [Nanoarchaeota archaeon]
MRYEVPSPKEIRKSFQKSEYSFIEYHIHRRISPYLTWVFLRFTIIAELIALLTPLVDLLTLYSISRGNFIFAAILTQVHIILDSSDGEIARFRKTVVKRSKNQEAFGALTDSLVGLLIFPFIIFYVGLEFGGLITGLISMGAFYLLVVSSAYTKIYYPKSKIGKDFREKCFGKRKYKWGFNSIIQKSLITLALLFQSVIFLWIFVLGAITIVVLRIYLLYRQK